MFTPLSLPNELWLAVSATNERYFISTMGRLLTTAWKGTNQARIMKPALDAQGYLRTMIMQHGRLRTVKMHRLVALEFLPNPLGLPQVNHKNGIKHDNQTSNLEWMSAKQNSQHAENSGLRSHAGEKNAARLLTDAKVLEIRQKFKPRVYTRPMLATEYGVTVATIKKIVSGAAWKHLL